VQPDNPFADSLGSFREPIAVPVDEPNAGTLMHVCFNRAWLPSILGSLLQLLQQATWRTDDPDLLHTAQLRSCLLIDMFMSEWCEMTTGMIAFFAIKEVNQTSKTLVTICIMTNSNSIICHGLF